MIEQRTVSYGWQSTPNNSRSIRSIDDEQVGLNYVQNPSAQGTTSSLTSDSGNGSVAMVTDNQTGLGSKSYKVTVGSASYEGAITSPAPASAGAQWWFRATARIDPTDIGPRTFLPVLRFYDGSGTLLQATDGPRIEQTPAGVFNRWTGTPGASTSEQYDGDTRRVNTLLNPSFRNDQSGWTVDSAFTQSGSGVLIASAGQDVADEGLIVYTDALAVQPGASKSARMDVEVSVNEDNPSQTLALLVRFFDSSGNAIGDDTYGPGGEVIDETTTLILNNAVAPLGAATYRLALTVVDGLPAETVVTISNALVEDNITVGDYFDGDVLSTGIGYVPDAFDLSVSAVAPANTTTVRAVVLRVPVHGWEPSTDVFYLDNLLLTQTDDTTVPAYYDGDFPSEEIYVNVVREGELTTDEWWEIDGVALNTHAYNITSKGGNRLSPPNVRGANITVPGRRGTVFQEKELDVNQVTLNMWVQGSDTFGNIPERDVSQQFLHHWKTLRRLLFKVKRELTVTKRWVDWETNAVISATGKAQYNGGLEPQMTGGARAIFSVDLLFNDPLFYSQAKTLTASGVVKKQWRETHEGDWTTTAIVATFAGPRVNPRLTVTDDEGNTTWVKYTGTLAQGDTLTLDVDNFEATLTRASGATTDVIGSITHGGDEYWLGIGSGVNDILLESTSGSGSVALDYLPVWF